MKFHLLLLAFAVALPTASYAAKENFERTKPHVNKEQKDHEGKAAKGKKKPKEIVVVGAEGKEVEVSPKAAEALRKAREKKDSKHTQEKKGKAKGKGKNK
ncbi:hypothetical protein QSV34_00090 [Porticoccus sp. W117]|uniref:hypothetical protein n=1 Tax=Porticoccus sp. W117 TaxID=3054777 RepID=UPI00259608A3|nr:hypothetical protein [Porticoccus sp. W117]MDM3869740.1 hypothetical protein [Porticoccus sp. W117]